MVGNFSHFGTVVIFRKVGVFWGGFLHRINLMWFKICFSHVFDNYNFFTQSDDFAEAVDFGCWLFFAILEMLSLFDR